MNLNGDFYKVKEKTSAGNKISVVIELDPSHEIYKGHFPQQPIVPGVLQIQILKELLEEQTGKKFMMTAGDNIKFTGMIIPSQSPLINIEMNYQDKENEMITEAKLFMGDTVFTKYKGKFKII
jgi:3-hydroxyacyl-[acyl-carrier-protein] dehydratase